MPSNTPTINAIFAYGTLRRGFCRESCWPRKPLQVDSAFVRGRLVDVGPYPGLLPGVDWVRGELWRMEPQDLAPTLQALDAVEGFAQRDEPDWYQRIVIDVFSAPDGRPIGQAFTYQLAMQNLIDSAQPMSMRIQSDGLTYAQWPDLRS